MKAEPISLKHIKIDSSFWKKRINLIRKTVIPYQWELLNDRIKDAAKSGAVQNFKIAAGKEKGEFYGCSFQDSDLAKWLEAVAYSLATNPDKKLEAITDEIIDLIAEAQDQNGYLVTIDNLGEKSKYKQDILDKARINHQILNLIIERGMSKKAKKAKEERKPYPHTYSSTISIKPSAFIYHSDEKRPNLEKDDLFMEFLDVFLKKAEGNHVGVTIDMEEPYLVDYTIDIYLSSIARHKNVGIVHQTSLDRTTVDLDEYVGLEGIARVRLCIGIYDITKKNIWAEDDIERKEENIGTMNLKKRKERLVNEALALASSGIYTEIATHDVEVIKEIQELFEEHKISKDLYEFQALYNVKPEGLEKLHKELMEDGVKVRIYLPYAHTLDDTIDYGIRRASKNPQLLWTFMKEGAKFYIKKLFSRNRQNKK